MKVELEGNLPDLEAMANQFPQFAARILGYVGKETAVEFAQMMERGEKGIQYRSMRGNRKSEGGRRMITYSVGKGVKFVRVSSFPLNFFEGGRALRSGKREGARNILRGSLKSVMSGKLPGTVNDAANMIVDDWFNKRAKEGRKYI